MIKRLHITDFAIVSNLSVEFASGLNILSGETGAGKSIILGALNLLLGERAQLEMIRTGAEQAVVEGWFESFPIVSRMLKELNLEPSTETIEIRREIRRNGRSRCFINGNMVALTDLKNIGGILIDLVGQHHGQLLLNKNNHVLFLDEYAGNSILLEKYQTTFESYNKTKADLMTLKRKIQTQTEKHELYKFQLQEIESANLSAPEEIKLDGEKQILENAEKLKSSYYDISEQLYHGENSTTEILTGAFSKLDDLKKYDNSLEKTIESLKENLISLQEIGRFLESRSQEIEHDPKRLQKIEDRLEIYYNLKNKYGGSLPELFNYQEKISSSLNDFTDSSKALSQLENELAISLRDSILLAEKLSKKRHQSGANLSREIASNLSALRMGQVDFEIQINYHIDCEGEYSNDGKQIMLGSDGFDEVEFLFSPNPGEDVKALAKIASGGELSRVLLALKTIVSAKNENSCLIFDEIDSGIGGKTASAVGKSLQKLARDHQVVAITHLQQIAACGETHFLVFKEKTDQRMTTHIKKLTLKQRKEEIGRMISGDNVTNLSLRQAAEMLNNDQN